MTLSLRLAGSTLLSAAACPIGTDIMISSSDIADAKLMLAYAGYKSITLDDSIIRPIAKAGTTCFEKTDNDVEFEFIKAHNLLAAKISPVTAKSISSCLFPQPGQRTQGADAARKYTVWGLVVLAFLFFFQGYSITIASIVTSIKSNQDVLKQYEAFEDSIRFKLKQEKGASNLIDKEINQAIDDAYDANSTSIVHAQEKNDTANKASILTMVEKNYVLSLQRNSLDALRRLVNFAVVLFYPQTGNGDTYFFFNMYAREGSYLCFR